MQCAILADARSYPTFLYIDSVGRSRHKYWYRNFGGRPRHCWLGTATNTTTSYNPQSNGLVERMHRRVKVALQAKLESEPNWIDVLPVIMLELRAAVKQDMDCSAVEMVYGEELRLGCRFCV